MRTVLSYDVTDSVLRQIGTDFVVASTVNWRTANTSNAHAEFEQGLDADLAIDYAGIKTYFKNNEPIAWVDFENGYGYKEQAC